MFRITETTDDRHKGQILESLPDVGTRLSLGDSEVLVTLVSDSLIVSSNYVIRFEGVSE